MELHQLTLGAFDKERHQTIRLILWTAPVFCRKCIERQRTDTEVASRADNLTDALITLMMPKQAGHPTLTRPPAITITNDGDVPWKTARIDFIRKNGRGSLAHVWFTLPGKVILKLNHKPLSDASGSSARKPLP